MYSLNAPVPGAVERLAADLYPRLTAFDRRRERHGLVCKRFEGGEIPSEPAPALERVRERLCPAPAVDARIDGIDYFPNPPRGPGPVVYLTVDSPGLFDLHDRLVEAFGAVEGLEGDDYTPHVTLARGGDERDAAALAALDIDPVEWTVSAIDLYDPRFDERVASLSLPC